MIKIKIKFAGKKVTIKEFGVKPLQMLQIGQAGLLHLKSRVALGIGLSDSPMPPLKQYRRITGKNGNIVNIGPDRGYIGYKKKQGKKPIRDLTLTGAMLDNLSVRSATANQVRIAFTTKLARQKALANQQRSPWLGWSDTDTAAVEAKAAQVFKNSVSSYFNEVKRKFRAAA